MANEMITHDQFMRESWEIWKKCCIDDGLDPISAANKVREEATRQGKHVPFYFPEKEYEQ